MKYIAIILSIISLSFHCYCQNKKIITPYYTIEIDLQKEQNKDSIFIIVAFQNMDKKSVFILDSFTAKWDFFKSDLEIYFGDTFINSRDSSQKLIEVIPGKTSVFRQIVPNYLNDSSIVRLLAEIISVQNPGTKENYVRKDFSRWQDYKHISYSFLSNCY